MAAAAPAAVGAGAGTGADTKTTGATEPQHARKNGAGRELYHCDACDAVLGHCGATCTAWKPSAAAAARPLTTTTTHTSNSALKLAVTVHGSPNGSGDSRSGADAKHDARATTHNRAVVVVAHADACATSNGHAPAAAHAHAHAAAPDAAATMRVRSGVSRIADTPIKGLAAATRQLIARGFKLIDMTQGVPNIDIVARVRNAVEALLRTKRLPYMDAVTERDVRVVCAHFGNAVYSLGTAAFTAVSAVTADHIVLTAGAVEALKAALALKVDGSLRAFGWHDVVLAPRPAYEVYAHQTHVLNGTFAHIESSACGYAPTPQDVRAAFAAHTKRVAFRALPECIRVQCRRPPAGAGATAGADSDSHSDSDRLVRVSGVKAVILNFPNNPTGAVLTRETAKALADELHALLTAYRAEPCVVVERAGVSVVGGGSGSGGGSGGPDGDGFVLILDEPYVGTGVGAHISVLHYASPLLLSHTLLVLSSSKALGAMPGARAAWLTAFGDQHATTVAALTHWQLACSGTSTLAAAGLQAALEHILASEVAVTPDMTSAHALMTNSAGDRAFLAQSKIACHYRARASFVAEYIQRVLAPKHGVALPIARGEGGGTPSSGFYVLCDFSAVKALSGGRIATDVQLHDCLRDMHSEEQPQQTQAQQTQTQTQTQTQPLLVPAAELLRDVPEHGPHAVADVARVYSGRTGLVLVPGCAFALPGHAMWMRFNVAKSWAELYTALSIVDRALCGLTATAAAATAAAAVAVCPAAANSKEKQ